MFLWPWTNKMSLFEYLGTTTFQLTMNLQFKTRGTMALKDVDVIV